MYQLQGLVGNCWAWEAVMLTEQCMLSEGRFILQKAEVLMHNCLYEFYLPKLKTMREIIVFKVCGKGVQH